MTAKHETLIRQLDLKHLRYFVAVAEELHFGRAAERLHMAQPPLSQQIQRLETILGSPLLERRPRVRLTNTGRNMLEISRRLLSQLDDGIGAVLDTASGVAGTLTIGFAASTLMTPLTRSIRQFRHSAPNVVVHLRELSTAEQEDALRRGDIDVGFLRGLPAESRGLKCETVLQERFHIALPPGHRLASRKTISIASLRGESVVLFPADVAPGLHAEIQQMFDAAGVRPPVVQWAREWFTIVGLVEAGLGFSIVPASFTRLKLGRVAYRPVAEKHRRTEITLCTNQTRAVATAAAFARIARETFRVSA